MNIWISKGPLVAVSLISLTACDGGQVTEMLQRVSDALPKPRLAAAPAPKAPSRALAQAIMAEGAVTLVPPKGYCIDGTSLQNNFALMARCAAINPNQNSFEAPVGVLSVSMTPASDSTLPEVSAISAANGLSQVAQIEKTETSVTFSATGTPPDKSYAVQQWRGATVTGGYVLGLTLYPEQGGRGITEDGRDMLIGLIRRTRQATD